MPGINESRAHSWDDVERTLVRHTDHELDRARCMPHRVQRFRVLLPPTSEELGVLLLNVRRIGEHYRTEVTRRWRTPDRGFVPMPHEEGKAACMIDVGVREHDGIDGLDRNRKARVLLVRLATLTLK